MIRSARSSDYDAYVRLHGELGIPDPVKPCDIWIESVMPRVWVACDERGKVVGYVSWRAYGAIAHVIHLVVDPAVRGRRVGEELLVFARDAAKAIGCTRWYLNVKRDNTPALKLYERCGLRLELESFALEVPWSVVPRVDVRERTIDDTADDDATIESLFNVPADRVASFRARGLRLLTLRDETDAILGFAPFDPSFPGAPTFSARQPDLAVPLLEVIRHYADPTFDFVRIAVEGDKALADAVIALGAKLNFEILRLSAAIS